MKALLSAVRPALAPVLPHLPPQRTQAPRRAAVFIDKDGTLVQDTPGQATDPANPRFMPGALNALAALYNHGFVLVIASNESGLALGGFSRAEFAVLQRALLQKIFNESEAVVTDLMTCPHTPGLDGRPRCLCRKPAPGLLRQAAQIHRLDLARSWMIGDLLDDVEAGQRAGCRTVLLDVGHETQWRLSPLRTPHHQARDMTHAAEIILKAAHREVAQEALGVSVA